MTRVMIVADNGPAMAALTRALRRMPDLEIVRYASGRNTIGPLVRASAPELVLIDEMHWRADALRAGAAAVLPASVDPATLELVLREVLVTDPQVHTGASLAA
jgi:DNA-binding NarL/FixJ family response regulator